MIDRDFPTLRDSRHVSETPNVERATLITAWLRRNFLIGKSQTVSLSHPLMFSWFCHALYIPSSHRMLMNTIESSAVKGYMYVAFISVEVTTSRKTLHLYLCISVTWRLLLRRNILNKERCILFYPWVYIMFWVARFRNKGTNKQISIYVPCSL